MSEITFLIPARSADTLHRTLSMLSFQKDRGFRALVVDIADSETVRSVAEEFEERIPVGVVEADSSGRPLWKSCLDAAPEAEWVCFLTPGVDLTSVSVKRMRRCIGAHDGYDVFHWNLAEPERRFPLKTSAEKLFLKVFEDGMSAPLSSFVFRAAALRKVFEADPEAAGMELAVVLSGAKEKGIRSVRRDRIGYRKPDSATDPDDVEKEVRSRLAFFRWSERFFGEDYPLGTGDRLNLFAGELARLYPAHTYDELKEDLGTFSVVNGPIRKMKAASALKSALKARGESLK